MRSEKISNTDPVMELTGYVLAGGSSRRMGRPKHLIELNGVSLEKRAASTLAEFCSETVVVTGRSKPTENGLRTIPDKTIGDAAGPLVALCTAAEDCSTELFAVIPCDMPFLDSEIFLMMFEMFDISTDAVVPVQPDGIVQPLVGLYRAEAVRKIAPDVIASGRLSPAALLDTISTRYLAWADIQKLTNADLIFTNLNTPEDLKSANSKFLKEAVAK